MDQVSRRRQNLRTRNLDDLLAKALDPGIFIDSDHPAVQAFARAAAGHAGNPREQAVRLYYAVRDGFRYDPYTVDLTGNGLKASAVLAAGHGWCVTKGALLVAACRAVGVPARMGFADVRNHLSTERLRQAMQTDEFIWHGYAAIHLDGRWLKATPAFNIELCQKFSLKPLEFDGREDSIYHPYDLSGKRHMEYLRLRGEWDDIPADQIRVDFARYYPKLNYLRHEDFGLDVNSETGVR